MLRAGLPGRRGVFAGFRAAGFSVDASAMMPNATLARAGVALPEPPPSSCISHGSLLSKVLNTRVIACLGKCSESARITLALSSRNCSGVNSRPKISSISSSRLRPSRVSSSTLWMVSMEQAYLVLRPVLPEHGQEVFELRLVRDLPDVSGGGLGLGLGHVVQGLVDLLNLRRLELYQPGEGPGLGPCPVPGSGRRASRPHALGMPSPRRPRSRAARRCTPPASSGIPVPGVLPLLGQYRADDRGQSRRAKAGSSGSAGSMSPVSGFRRNRAVSSISSR